MRRLYHRESFLKVLPVKSSSSSPSATTQKMSSRYFAEDRSSGDADNNGQSGYKPKCFNCGEVGHISADCSKPAMKMACYNCGENGHKSRECPKERAPKTCYRCNEVGHISSQCPNSSSHSPRSGSGPREGVCYRCRQPGHFANDCSQERRCYKCQQPGHLAADCTASN